MFLSEIPQDNSNGTLALALAGITAVGVFGKQLFHFILKLTKQGSNGKLPGRMAEFEARLGVAEGNITRQDARIDGVEAETREVRGEARQVRDTVIETKTIVESWGK